MLMGNEKELFCIAHLNVRGLASKFDQIVSILNDKKFSVFCLAETFLNEFDNSCLYNISGYEMIRCDRPGSAGGGLLCYVKDIYCFELLSNFDNCLPESLGLLFKLKFQKNFIVSFLYRPPNKPVSWNDAFVSYVDHCYDLADEVTILGDFNFNLFDKDVKRKWLENVIGQLSLFQLITEPTRVSESSSSLIDHIYTSKPENFNVGEIFRCSLSDHYLIFVTRKMGVKKSKIRTKVFFNDYSQLTESNISAIFRTFDWQQVLSLSSVDEMLNCFYKNYVFILNSLVVRKSRFVKSCALPAWLDDEVRAEMKIRDGLKHNKEWVAYRRKRNFVTNLIRRKKKLYIESVINSCRSASTKPVWNALNLSSKPNSSVKSDLSSSALNLHFASIACKLTHKLSGSFSKADVLPSSVDSIPPLTPSLCLKYLNSISDNKSAGPDNVSVKMLKFSFSVVVDIITDMINRMLIEGVFPKQWKLARVTPIFKGGNKNDPSNFRPISVVSVLSKILEKHVNLCLQKYLEDNNILHEQQSGFRKGFSCNDAVLRLVSCCNYFKNKGDYVSLMFLDFKKAFDCVDHSLLLLKLRSVGVTGQFHSLLSSFLSDRFQFVKFNGDVSDLLPINAGVPQGSILAPTLFLVFINDLLQLPLHSSSFAYADDTAFISHSSDKTVLEMSCNKDLEKICNWCDTNKMVINTSKSHFLLCDHSGSSQFVISFRDVALSRSSSTKLLGFYLDDSLSWNNHVSQISKTLRSNLSLFRKCRPYISRKAALIFYHQFIFCHLIYGIHIYYNLSPCYVTNPLFLLQKRSFRILAGVKKVPVHLISTKNLSSSLQLLPLPQLARYFTSIYCFKILNKLSPPFISNLFLNVNHSFSLRDKFLLHPPRNKFLIILSSEFNKLPLSLRSSTNLCSFKANLFQHLMSEYLSSM